ncbi:MAG TPA: hypothetical protein VD816_15905 [Ohtaekwangia sp.]|nr:hypothetical protein [Ohtaekwangia sp.]
MKFFILTLLFASGFLLAEAQSIVGNWQMVKHTSCLEDEMTGRDDDLVDDLKSRSGTTSRILELKDNNTAEESTKIISNRKSYNSKSFLYKLNGSTLYFLDKRSRTIIETFTVEKLDADSLIISDTRRGCETKVFLRTK